MHEEGRLKMKFSSYGQHLNPLAAVDMSDKADHGLAKDTALSGDVLVVCFACQEANSIVYFLYTNCKK